MYSFGAKSGEERGVMEQEALAACLAPSLDRNTIAATLSDLREQLLYLHYVGRRYRFETKPNLNKLVADEESKIAADDVLEKIQAELSKSLQTNRGKVVLWPHDSAAINDRVPQFSIIYLNPDWAEKSREAALVEALRWLEYRGNDKREYKNALAFVVPNQGQMDKARKGARTALALASLLQQKAKYKFTPEDTEELTSKAKEANSEVNAAIRRLYDYILLPLPNNESTSPIRLETIDFQSQLNTSQNLQDRVLDALRNHVFDSIKPAKLLQFSSLESSETEYIKAEELVSYFFRFPTLPKMMDTVGIKAAMIKGIEQGLFGYVPTLNTGSNLLAVENPNLISFQRVIPTDELDLSGYLLSPSLVERLKAIPDPNDKLDPTKSGSDHEPTTNTADDYSIYGSTIGSTPTVVAEAKKAVEYKTDNSSITRSVLADIVDGKRSARSYKLNSVTNKSKIFELFQILQALSDKADDMTIQIEVRAHTQKEFDINWIRNAIEEPLDELDIQSTSRLE